MTLYKVKDGKIVEVGKMPEPVKMPSLKEFRAWCIESEDWTIEDAYDYFKSRIKPIEWPSDEGVLDEARAYGKRQWVNPGATSGFSKIDIDLVRLQKVTGFLDGVAWLRDRMK